jgi:hypothetical protein
MVVERELQEKEEEVTGTFERGHVELSFREANLNTHEDVLEAEQKFMGELCASLLARKLTTGL